MSSNTTVSPISISSYMSKTDSGYHLQGLKAVSDELATDKPIKVFDPTCIRKRSNLSSVKNEHKFDDASFNPEHFLADVPNSSPKLNALLKKIAALDRRDESKYGRNFKHFIFSDIKPFAKLLASALISTGWKLGYKADIRNQDKIDRAIEKGLKLPKAIWGPLELLPNSELERNTSFYLLSSVGVFDKPISVRLKKEILARFNERPDNIYGNNARIIVMDSGFKEGIDLFDIKYVHIFEPSLNAADQKQVIGRGTRTCGQKGLEFHPTRGWPLEVFLYDLEIPAPLRASLLGSETARELLMKAMNVDVRLANFGYDIERLSVIGSVDYELNTAVHNFSVDLEADEEEIVLGGAAATQIGGAHLKFGEKKGANIRYLSQFDHKEMVKYVRENYGQYKWEDVKMENLCVEKGGSDSAFFMGGAASIINYTPSQSFIGHYFHPRVPVKGMLLYHSVGSGKTCSAIAAATANFEPEGYTILWVTRTTLKNDIWKNMFVQVCNENIRNRIASGEHIPDEPKEQMKLLSKAWRIRPISYKQFSNLVSKQNSYYQRLVKENGEADPLRKTLLIIDEAHKLYGGGDLSSLERPDMNALHKSLMTSYEVSGNDSARLLLMTATPITESPMEMVKLVNLCKTMENQMPTTFEVFSENYLNEDGRFSKSGERAFLDDIAGHISYLNREKDARQFSQPIIKRVMVPIVSESQMKDVKDFDTFIAKSDAEAEVLQLESEVEHVAERIEGELSEIDKTRFQHLKKICNEHAVIPRKKCNSIINRNITDLVREAKGHVKEIKDQSKNLKEQIKTAKSRRQDILRQIKNRILENPELFSRYKKSTYASLRNACSSTVKTSKQFLDAVKDIPEVQELNRRIDAYKEEIVSIENQAVVSKNVLKLKIKAAKEMLKDPNIAPLERSILELTIRTYQKESRKTIKNSEMKYKIEDLQENIKGVESDKKKVFSHLRKSIKKMVKDRRTNMKESRKELRNVRKTLRKQGKLEDEIESDEIRDMVDRRKVLIERDLEEIENTIREKEVEKLRKTQAKAAEREENAHRKREEKDRAARDRQAERERAKLEKKREKDAAKTKKKQEQKEAKEAAKAATKTKKNTGKQ